YNQTSDRYTCNYTITGVGSDKKLTPKYFPQLGIGSLSFHLVGSPTAQVHDLPQRFLRLLGFLTASIGDGGRHPDGLRQGPHIVLGTLVQRSESVVPSAESSLIFECFHCSHTRCRYPRSFPHGSHLPPRLFCVIC
ncbi:unnamed protein product, partial [Musa acuminata var. zebrina]